MACTSHVLQLETHLSYGLLDSSYETARRGIQSVHQKERERILRLREVLLSHEKDNLQVKLFASDARIQDLTATIWKLEGSLENSLEQNERAKREIRAKSREAEKLNAEISTLQGVTVDSTKLLTEKLTLAHEIASMRPELDHLRRQIASQETLVSEKLSLERQKSILQVELENEKRSTKRVANKERDVNHHEEDLASRLADLQSDLARERKEKQKIERDAQNRSMETEHKMSALSSRLDTLRNKLRISDEKLKSKQEGLLPPPNVEKESSLDHTRQVYKKNARHSRMAKIDESTIIGTPGQMPVDLRTKSISAAVGEKSIFSTTPFLSRATNAAPLDTAASSEQSSGEDRERTEDQKDAQGDEEKLKLSGHHRQPNTNVQWNLCDSVRVQPQSAAARLSKGKLGLISRVKTKDGDSKSRQPLKHALEKPDNADPFPKAKRRLLTGGAGKTLFDDEERPCATEPPSIGEVPRPGLLRRLDKGSTRINQSSTGHIFGAISPLKKDRKMLAK